MGYHRLVLAIYGVAVGVAAIVMFTHLAARSTELEESLRDLHAIVLAQQAALAKLQPSQTTPSPPSPLPAFVADEVEFAGVRTCGAYLAPDGVVFHGPLDYGKKLCPVRQLDGSLLVAGTIVTGGMLLQMGNTTVNMTHFILTQQQQAGAACLNQCQGTTGLRNTLTCDCECVEGWGGDDCSERVCLNGGTLSGGVCLCVTPYDPATNCATLDCGEHGRINGATLNTCTCDPGYTGTPCVLDSAPTSAPTVCPDGSLGANCEFQCFDPRLSHISPSNCSVRSNWGETLDCFNTGEEYACGCGWGGFVPESENYFVMGVLRCAFSDATLSECQAQFDEERPLCCAPGGRCGETYRAASVCETTDASCCAELSPLGGDYCRASGCTWCPTAGTSSICVALEYSYVGCTATAASAGEGRWTYFTFTTDNVEEDVSQEARQQALDAYAPCLFEPITSSCFDNASMALDNLPWPTLQLGEYTLDPTTSAFTITFPDARVALGIELPYSAASVLSATIKVISVPIASNKCPASVAPLMASPTQEAVTPSVTSYHLYVSSMSGTHHCLTRPRLLDSTEQLVLFGGTVGLPELAFVPTITASGLFMSPDLLCTPFVITTNAIYTEEGLGLSVDLVSGAVSLKPFATAVMLAT